MDSYTHSDNLIEAREILEITAVKMAAERRSSRNLENIQAAQDDFREQRLDKLEAVEEDLLFHLKIAEASKNSVLKSLMLIIIPDIINNFINLDVCKDNRSVLAVEEH